MFFYIIIFLLIVGLFFSIRAIVLRRNVGCGVMGIVSICLIIAAPFLLIYLLFTPPLGFYKDLYEEVIGLPYPASAKVIKKDGASSIIDYNCMAVIKVDTTDYQKALQKMQSSHYLRDTAIWHIHSFIEKAGLEPAHFNKSFYTPGTHGRVVGFHCNGQVIFVRKYRY